MDSFNLLGLIIDTNLNWKNHIENIKSKLSKFIYALFELKCSTNLETALAAYYGYAYSWLKYGVMLWGNSTNANEVFILQKKCIRILAQINNKQSCKPYFVEYKILTLPSIYIQDICTFVFKNPQLFKQVKDTHNINTRHKNRFFLPPSRLKMLNCSPYYMSVKIFNKLPSAIKSEQIFNKFIKKMRTYLIDKCFYTLDEFLND